MRCKNVQFTHVKGSKLTLYMKKGRVGNNLLNLEKTYVSYSMDLDERSLA